jgi:hypothetical protein
MRKLRLKKVDQRKKSKDNILLFKRQLNDIKLELNLINRKNEELLKNINIDFTIDKRTFELYTKYTEEMKVQLKNLLKNLNVIENEKKLNHEDNHHDNDEKFLTIKVENNLESEEMNSNLLFAHEIENNKIRISKIDDLIEVEDEKFFIDLNEGNLKTEHIIPLNNLIKFIAVLNRNSKLCGENFDKCLISNQELLNKDEEFVNIFYYTIEPNYCSFEERFT